MHVARPSQVSVTKAVAAAVAAGLTPVEINLRPDGSVQIMFLQKSETELTSTANADHAPVSLVDQRKARRGKV